ncbi:helix-turn-helix domain-containing protein [Streptomyces sp. NPDC059761]|uniref:helix-turn-helix domain-containing protein n=1 Tax=Streptomyces sp. NPDC059761 TaxID=3346937 RepID=UPI003666A280
MGRRSKPVNCTYPRRAELAQALRYFQGQAGLTFEAMAARPGVTVSVATLKRAASGDTVPKAKTVKEFAAVCGVETLRTDYLLRMRILSRIEDRGVLRRLRAPTVELIADRPDLSLALAYAYEAAGAPTLREIQENSDNPHALPLSTVGRIVARKTVPADEQQLLAFLHGCGVRDQDAAWRKAWAKAATAHEGLVEHPRVPDSGKASASAGAKTGRIKVVLRPEALAKLEELAESGARSDRTAGGSDLYSRTHPLRPRLDRETFPLLVARQEGAVLSEDWRGRTTRSA